MYQDLSRELAYQDLVQRLRQHADNLETPQDWPHASLQACGEAGVHRWFVSQSDGGLGWTESQVTCGYLLLSRYCLTTAFILTQRTGAMKRIAHSSNPVAKARWLPGLVDGSLFGTVGISHLTTSRQHVQTPALRAQRCPAGGFVLNGYSPWITGAAHADVFVIGATLDDGEQILAAVPADRQGVKAHAGYPLVALSASCTDRVDFEEVHIGSEDLLAGPMPDVMKQGVGAGTGGLQTSTLAVGLAMSSVEFLERESESRTDFVEVAKKMRRDVDELREDLLRVAAGEPACTPGEIRQRANSLALRTTQAALTAAKGAGFVQGHPVGRWAREALFFLVWSCPQPVLQANLCELAGLGI